MLRELAILYSIGLRGSCNSVSEPTNLIEIAKQHTSTVSRPTENTLPISLSKDIHLVH